MTTQDKLDHPSISQPQSWPLAAFFAAALIGLMTVAAAKADPGDQWILPIDHHDGTFLFWPGAGYDGTDAIEFDNAGTPNPVTRVYWAMNGLSLNSSNAFPTTTELYTLEWFQPNGGPSDWQPIEGNLRGNPGIAGSDALMDPIVPWVGAFGQNHQWIGAEGIAGTPGTWTTTGPGPHTPESTDYNAGPNGIFMWLKAGAYLYAKWDFGFRIDHTWSALRLTQVTGTITQPVIQSASMSGNTLDIRWSASPVKTYQVQYKTNLTQVGWVNLGGTTPGSYPTATASDVNPPDARRFYRVEVLP